MLVPLLFPWPRSTPHFLILELPLLTMFTVVYTKMPVKNIVQ